MKGKTKKEKESARRITDPTFLLGREDAYVDLGPYDFQNLPIKERKDRHYIGRDPKYWIDTHILLEWLIIGESTELENCMNSQYQKWYLKTKGIEFPTAKWITAEEAEKLISQIQSFPFNPKSQNIYQKEVKKIKTFLYSFFEKFSYEEDAEKLDYKEGKLETVKVKVFKNYFFKRIIARKHVADEMKQFIHYLSSMLAKYKALLHIQGQLHKKIDHMMLSTTERKKLIYNFGPLIKTTYRKNDVLLNALCLKIDYLVKSMPCADRLKKIIPYLLTQLDILYGTHEKCRFMTDKRKTRCGQSNCLSDRVIKCFKKIFDEDKYEALKLRERERIQQEYLLPSVKEKKLAQKSKEIDEDKKRAIKNANKMFDVTCRRHLCDNCKNKRNSPYRNPCPNGMERYEYRVKSAQKNFSTEVYFFANAWLSKNNLREVSERCPFCGKRLYLKDMHILYCINCKSAFLFAAHNNLQDFVGKKPSSTISLAL
ncbi:MAG: hypothetical protein M0Z64_08075 [Nitrospiraceae bacterium]|nr:hypothetical protein [Nitrospiraceae bacterium]